MSRQPSYKDLEKRIHDLEKKADRKTYSDRLTRTLFSITYAVSKTHDLNDLYQSIYDSLNGLMKLPNFYIAIFDEKQNMIRFPFHKDENKEAKFADREYHQGNSLTSEVIMKKEPLFLKEKQLKIYNAQKKIIGPLPKIWIGVPLMIRQKVIGVVAIQSYTDPDYFTKETVDIIVAASNHIALAIERKQSLEERDLLENYLYNIINSMPSILIALDKEGRVTQWNFQAELETLVTAELAVGRRLVSVFPRLSTIIDTIKESIRENKLRTLLKQEYPSGNQTRYEDIIIYPVSTESMDGAVIRIDDITEQVRLEEIMIQSEKMMSIGGLAAGMAHEINNPLAGMMQNAQVVYNRLVNDIPVNNEAAAQAGISMEQLRDYMEKRQILEKLDLIHATGNRAARIVKNMLSFARKSDTVLETCDLARLLDKTIELARNDYDLKKQYDFKLIKILKNYDPNVSHVMCDKSKIQQVFLNILKNGAQALFKKRSDSFTPQFTLTTTMAKNMACVRIEDNGPGVDEETRKRMFEPFFTTKSVGEGTGLGLSVSYFIIVTDHKGELLIESSPGKGTAFIIKLPR